MDNDTALRDRRRIAALDALLHEAERANLAHQKLPEPYRRAIVELAALEGFMYSAAEMSTQDAIDKIFTIQDRVMYRRRRQVLGREAADRIDARERPWETSNSSFFPTGTFYDEVQRLP